MLKIYTKENCSNCIAAKHLLNSKQIPFTELRIGRDVSAEVLIEALPSAKTVPQIFNDDQYVGGYSELLNYLKENKYGTAQYISD